MFSRRSVLEILWLRNKQSSYTESVLNHKKTEKCFKPEIITIIEGPIELDYFGSAYSQEEAMAKKLIVVVHLSGEVLPYELQLVLLPSGEHTFAETGDHQHLRALSRVSVGFWSKKQCMCCRCWTNGFSRREYGYFGL